MSRVSGSAGLELSQWRMRSPWRVPRWSAERRARPAGRAAVLRRARRKDGAPIGAPPPFALLPGGKRFRDFPLLNSGAEARREEGLFLL
jgi:hypothetical protein